MGNRASPPSGPLSRAPARNQDLLNSPAALSFARPPDRYGLNQHWEEPSESEVLALAFLAYAIFVCTIVTFSSYSQAVDNFGDSPAYMEVASAIRRWSFSGVRAWQFWGYPYCMALTSTVVRVSDRTALLLVSSLASFVSIFLAYRLWGGWVAAFFAVLSFDWMQRSLLGGAEPLFLALLFAAFLAVRHQHWWWGALLMSLATIVRPLGLLALVGFGGLLLLRRQYAKYALATLTGLAIGTLYMLPLWRYFDDPLATVHSYQAPERGGGSLFGLPFVAIVKGTLFFSVPWTNLVLSFIWIGLVLAGVAAMLFKAEFREYARRYPAEVLFAAAYLAMIFSYNYNRWARVSFARFAIPVIPVVLFALKAWVPKQRWVVWGIGCVSPVLAAASALGIRNVLQVLRN